MTPGLIRKVGINGKFEEICENNQSFIGNIILAYGLYTTLGFLYLIRNKLCKINELYIYVILRETEAYSSCRHWRRIFIYSTLLKMKIQHVRGWYLLFTLLLEFEWNWH